MSKNIIFQKKIKIFYRKKKLIKFKKKKFFQIKFSKILIRQTFRIIKYELIKMQHWINKKILKKIWKPNNKIE